MANTIIPNVLSTLVGRRNLGRVGVLVCLFVLANGTPALAASTLNGEIFTWTGGSEFGRVTCTGGTSFTYDLPPPATKAAGPFTGVFRESGTVTLSGTGAVTGWTADFQIFGSSAFGSPALVTGHKTLVSGGSGACTQTSFHLTDSATATGTLTYTATFADGSPAETGTSTASLSIAMIGGGASSPGSSFQEVFSTVSGPTRPTSKAQCRHGGFEKFSFKNQGQCIKFVNEQKHK